MHTLRGYLNNLDEIGCLPETLIIHERGVDGNTKRYTFSLNPAAGKPLYNDEFRNFMITDCWESEENELIVYMENKTVKGFIREMQHKNNTNEVCFCKAGDKFNDLVAFSLNESSKLPQYNGEFGGWLVSGYDVFEGNFISPDLGKCSNTLIVYIT